MKVKHQLNKLIGKTEVGRKALGDQQFRIFLFAFGSMGWNLAYGLFNGVLAIVYRSVWFATLFAFYVILGCMRLSVVSLKYQKKFKRTEATVMRQNGIALLILAVVLCVMTYLTFLFSAVRANNKIVMIAIATYTFYIAVSAIVKIVKAIKHHSPSVVTLRNISCAGATASMLSLQRSMVVTFGEGDTWFYEVMNGAAGLGAFLIVAALGVGMLIQSYRSTKLGERVS